MAEGNLKPLVYEQRPPVFTGSLCSENVADVLMFLAAARPLSGCDYSGDRRFEHGQQLVTEWIALQHEISVGGADALELPVEGTVDLVGLYECANVLWFLASLEARPGFSLDDGKSVAVGRTLIYQWLRERLEYSSATHSQQPHENSHPMLELFERLAEERGGAPGATGHA